MKNQFEKIEDSALRTRNLIQIDLAGLFFEKHKITDEDVTAWTEMYSKKFREVIDQHPEYLALYAENRKEALDKISEELYGKGGIAWKIKKQI